MPDLPLTARRLVLGWTLDPGPAVAVALAITCYVVGIRRLAAGGRRWPRARTVAFGAGLAVVVMATQSSLATYDSVLFSVHAVQHVLLGMVAPLLLALGAPVTLALQASSRSTQTALVRLLHSRPMVALTQPVVVLVVFVGSVVAGFLSPLHELSLDNAAVHAAVHLATLSVGCVFFWLVVGIDPSPRRLPHGARLLVVFLTMPVHALVGVAILSTAELLADGGYADAVGVDHADALADQRVAGGILWVTGDLFGLVATGVVLTQWMAHDRREALRYDARSTPPPDPTPGADR